MSTQQSLNNGLGAINLSMLLLQVIMNMNSQVSAAVVLSSGGLPSGQVFSGSASYYGDGTLGADPRK
jgi:hypothetical protein